MTIEINRRLKVYVERHESCGVQLKPDALLTNVGSTI